MSSFNLEKIPVYDRIELRKYCLEFLVENGMVSGIQEGRGLPETLLKEAEKLELFLVSGNKIVKKLSNSFIPYFTTNRNITGA